MSGRTWEAAEPPVSGREGLIYARFDVDGEQDCDERELLGLWMSRLMFGWMLPSELAYQETRSFEEFVEAYRRA